MGSALFGRKFPNEVIALRVEFYKVLCVDHGVTTIVVAFRCVDHGIEFCH